jgi:peptidoglycan/xylan/chitin deacetylase (PgdA/CDA1 family)
MNALKRSAGFAMRTGLGSAVLALTSPKRFLVLTYHRVNDEGHPFFGGTPVDLFRRQMEVARRLFSVYPLEELAARAKSGGVPSNALAITFDDGYRDNYTCAFPVLRELGLPATIFLVPDAIDVDPLLWHDRVFDAFHRSRRENFDFEGRSYPVSTTAERERALSVVLAKLRSSSSETRDRLVASVLDSLEVEPDPRRFEKLTWDDVREMSRAGVNFGAHTLDHPILSRVDPVEARRQIRESKRKIESALGSEVAAFAYPNGSATDFDAVTEKIVQEEGFSFAVTTIAGANDSETNPFRLHRVGMWGDDPSLSAARLAWTRCRLFH